MDPQFFGRLLLFQNRPFSLQGQRSPPQSSLFLRLLEETCLRETLAARGLGRAPPCLQHVCQPLWHHTVTSRKHFPPAPFHTILSQFTTVDPWCLGCCFRRLGSCPMLGFEVDFARAQEARPSDSRQRPEVPTTQPVPQLRRFQKGI